MSLLYDSFIGNTFGGSNAVTLSNAVSVKNKNNGRACQRSDLAYNLLNGALIYVIVDA